MKLIDVLFEGRKNTHPLGSIKNPYKLTPAIEDKVVKI